MKYLKDFHASAWGQSVNLAATDLTLLQTAQHIDGLVQDCSNSIASSLELLQSCTKSLLSTLSYIYIVLYVQLHVV